MKHGPSKRRPPKLLDNETKEPYTNDSPVFINSPTKSVGNLKNMINNISKNLTPRNDRRSKSKGNITNTDSRSHSPSDSPRFASIKPLCESPTINPNNLKDVMSYTEAPDAYLGELAFLQIHKSKLDTKSLRILIDEDDKIAIFHNYISDYAQIRETLKHETKGWINPDLFEKHKTENDVLLVD